MLNRVISAIALFIILTSTSLYAATNTWQIVSEKSSVNFSITPLHGTELAGSFDRMYGNIKIDPKIAENNRAHVRIDARTLAAVTHEMQQTLAAAPYLNVSAYPSIRFHAKQFMNVGNSSYLMRGTVTLRNQQIPMTLVMVFDEQTKQRAILRGSGLIQASALNLLPPPQGTTLTAKQNVRVDFSIALVR